MNTVLRRFIALVVFVMVGCMLPLTIAAQTGFDDLPDPTADAKQPTGVGDALPVTIDNTPDSIAKALMSRPAPGSTREGDNPVLFLIGNSTMRNGTRGDGSNGQWQHAADHHEDNEGEESLKDYFHIEDDGALE